MNLQKYNFYCPNCESQLDRSRSIHLDTERANGDKGVMYLSTTFGSYEYLHQPQVTFLKNESVNFFCPKCHVNLNSRVHPEFVSIVMRVEKQFDFEIIFSRKAGIHKTYIVTEDGIETYGKHSGSFNSKE